MSLVDYYDSDDTDEEEKVPEASEIEARRNSPRENQKVQQPIHQSSQSATPLPRPSIEKLPDASLLLNSSDLSSHIFSGNSYGSSVTATLVENDSRKRAANGAPSSSTQAKLPKRASSQSRKVGASGLLVPPQLSGRSNVVTEDISKLFVKRQNSQPSE